MRKIVKGKIYKHFKGNFYKVIAIAYDSEVYEQDKMEALMVVYENIETHECWVRPYKMFNSLVDRDKYPEVLQEYRFEEV